MCVVSADVMALNAAIFKANSIAEIDALFFRLSTFVLSVSEVLRSTNRLMLFFSAYFEMRENNQDFSDFRFFEMNKVGSPL